MTGDGERGQIVTVEAIFASLLLVGSLLFALHVVAITANTASTATPAIGEDHRSMATGALDEAIADGALKSSLLYWSDTERGFHGTEDGYYDARHPPTRFGDILNRTFGERQVRYNVDLLFENGTDDRATQRLIHHGTATDDAVRIERTVTLYDDDLLYNESGQAGNVTLAEADGFYAVDASPDTRVYAVVRVEVVLWQS